MGFRFRKSFGNKNFRVNVSKSGIGFSTGVKGARITKTAKGTTRTTASIPNTGISYTRETSSGSKRKKTTTTAAIGRKAKRIIYGICAAVLLLGSPLLMLVGELRVIAVCFFALGIAAAIISHQNRKKAA